MAHQPESDLESRETGVLILGAGLAGLRAAWAARQAEPDLPVLVVSLAAGPTGSSFTNLNNALGIQYCLDEPEVAAFCAEAAALAPPGRAQPALVRLMAEDSPARLAELEALGLDFRRQADGSLVRHPGCFSPAAPRAAVFDDLRRAHGLFAARAAALGAEFLPGYRVASLLVAQSRAVGALLIESATGRALAVSSRATIAALGGPAPLFRHNQAGSANPGTGLALLARAGARLANTAFVQFMWATVPDRTFFPLARLAEPGVAVRDAAGVFAPVPEEIGGRPTAELAASRAGHCPFGYGLADSRLDLYLADRLGPGLKAAVRLPGGEVARLAPMAHAGNGGAAVDARAATNVPGLYAAGECASLMHGANRLGGAMVLATQAFGKRAGEGAARDGATAPSRDEAADIARDSLSFMRYDPDERRAGLARLAEGLQRFQILGGRPGLADFARELDGWLPAARDHELRLAIETARLLLPGQAPE